MALKDEYNFSYNETESCDLTTFFSKFHDKLPVLLYITEGNYGDTIYDDFAHGQVIMFHKYFSKKRVLALEATTETSGKPKRYYDIPLDTACRFYVVGKKDTVKSHQTLAAILHDNKLPCVVQFAYYSGKLYERNEYGNLVQLVITMAYDDFYLLGNSVVRGLLLDRPCAADVMPLITVAPVRGIQDKTAKEFKSILRDMEKFVKSVTVTDIPEKKGIRVLTEGNQVLETILSSSDISKDIFGKADLYKKTPDHSQEDLSFPLHLPVRPPEVHPVYNVIELPPRDHSKVTKEVKSPVRKKGDYVNDNVCPVSPSVKTNRPLPPTPTSQRHSEYEGMEMKTPEENPYSELTKETISFNIETKTISEITDTLRKLKLDRHEKRFKNELIDGQILMKLKEDDFIREFGFSKIEAVRLSTFIRNGHIPK